jgi:hypothetical protein
MEQVTRQSINPTGSGDNLVSYRGSGAQMAVQLIARGWSADYGGTVVRMRGGAGPPPPVTQPPPVIPQQPQPTPQPQPATNTQ